MSKFKELERFLKTSLKTIDISQFLCYNDIVDETKHLQNSKE